MVRCPPHKVARAPLACLVARRRRRQRHSTQRRPWSRRRRRWARPTRWSWRPRGGSAGLRSAQLARPRLCFAPSASRAMPRQLGLEGAALVCAESPPARSCLRAALPRRGTNNRGALRWSRPGRQRVWIVERWRGRRGARRGGARQAVVPSRCGTPRRALRSERDARSTEDLELNGRSR